MGAKETVAGGCLMSLLGLVAFFGLTWSLWFPDEEAGSLPTSQTRAQVEQLIANDESAATGRRLELEELTKAPKLFEPANTLTCSATDGKKILTAIAALREAVSACRLPSQGEGDCYRRLGRKQERIHWITRQLEGVPMPNWTEGTEIFPSLELFGEPLMCCSCADRAAASCAETVSILDVGAERIASWMERIGAGDDLDNCVMTPAQIQLHLQREAAKGPRTP